MNLIPALSRFQQLALLLVTTYGMFSSSLFASETDLAIEPPGRLPDHAVEVFPADFLDEHPPGPSPYGRFSVRPARAEDRLPFSKVYTIQTTTQPEYTYQFQIDTRNSVSIHRGDTIYVEFWARTLTTVAESGQGSLEVALQQYQGDWTRSLDVGFTCGLHWKRIALAGRSISDYAPGEMHFGVVVGFRPQTLEIGGFRMVDLGPGVEPTNLPITRFDYPGRSLDAPWRKGALERIEKIRKGNLEIKVVDARGNPVPHAKIDIKMTRHAFPFGSCVDVVYLTQPGPDQDKYRQFILDNFNRVPIDNALKWEFWEAAWEDKKAVLQGLHWLKDHNIEVKGTTLIWPHASTLPADIPGLLNNRAALEKRVRDHFRAILTATKGLVVEWDCVNEPNADNGGIINTVGDDEVIKWFKWAGEFREPGVRMILNDYVHLNADNNVKEMARTESLFKKIQTAGAPIDAFGIQSHFGANVPAPSEVISELDRLGKELGVPLTISEFDLTNTDPSMRYDYTRDFLTACFSNPNVDEILSWGFWKDKHWMPAAAWLDHDWSVLPPGQAWLDQVKVAWWTHESAVSDANGATTIRGFLGSYHITVTSPDGKTTGQDIKMNNSSGASVKMTLP